MRSRLILAAIAALCLVATAPAKALDCDQMQNKIVELEFATANNGEPIFTSTLRSKAEKCTDEAGYYVLRGMPGKYTSPAAAQEAFQIVQKLKASNLTNEDLTGIYKFVAEQEKKKVDAAAKGKTAQK